MKKYREEGIFVAGANNEIRFVLGYDIRRTHSFPLFVANVTAGGGDSLIPTDRRLLFGCGGRKISLLFIRGRKLYTAVKWPALRSDCIKIERVEMFIDSVRPAVGR